MRRLGFLKTLAYPFVYLQNAKDYGTYAGLPDSREHLTVSENYVEHRGYHLYFYKNISGLVETTYNGVLSEVRSEWPVVIK